MPSTRRALMIIALAALTGCIELREAPELERAACTGCHGTATDPAPPPGLWLRDGGAGPGQAHAVHLQGGALAGPVACDSCHLVPAKVTAPGHMDDALPAEVRFAGLATGAARPGAPKLAPAYQAQGKRCSDTYCHGLSGAARPAPGWGEGPMSCGDCHGLPPQQTLGGGAHPAATLPSCAGCHGRVVNAAGEIIDTKLHVNGTAEVN